MSAEVLRQQASSPSPLSKSSPGRLLPSTKDLSHSRSFRTTVTQNYIPQFFYSLRHQLQHANLGPVHEEPERKAKVCACVQRWAFQQWHFPNGIAIRTRQQKVT